MITSDKEFFDKIWLEETKRYFKESYEFVCNYKNLGEKYIVSAVVHLDETTPHMHLVYISVIHTKDREGNEINKICARDFRRGRDNYRDYEIRKYNIKDMDSLHIAYAESFNIDYFITTDKLLINASKRAGLKMKVMNPIEFVMEVI